MSRLSAQKLTAPLAGIPPRNADHRHADRLPLAVFQFSLSKRTQEHVLVVKRFFALVGIQMPKKSTEESEAELLQSEKNIFRRFSEYFA
jgi:hypothetical protein